jgi:hypothetical protein
MAIGQTFRDRFREINFARSEKVPQQAYVGRAVVESLSDKTRWKSLNKGTPQGFIAPLPLLGGMGEESCIIHAPNIRYDGYTSKFRVHKTVR